MQLEAKKYLYDIQQAAAQIVEFTTGKKLKDYNNDPMLRAAVERKCEIIGEALAPVNWMRSLFPELVNIAVSFPSGTYSFMVTWKWMTLWFGMLFRQSFLNYRVKSRQY